jgi:hypothetical protein
MSAGAVAILLLILLVVYAPVREDVSSLTKPSAVLSSEVERARNQVDAFAALVLYQSRMHSELVIFAIAAVVLLGFMLRT